MTQRRSKHYTMQDLRKMKKIGTATVISASALLLAGVGMSAELNTKTFTADQKAKLRGVIVSRNGDTLKLRANDDSIGPLT